MDWFHDLVSPSLSDYTNIPLATIPAFDFKIYKFWYHVSVLFSVYYFLTVIIIKSVMVLGIISLTTQSFIIYLKGHNHKNLCLIFLHDDQK